VPATRFHHRADRSFCPCRRGWWYLPGEARHHLSVLRRSLPSAGDPFPAPRRRPVSSGTSHRHLQWMRRVHRRMSRQRHRVAAERDGGGRCL